jgi:ribosomal protein S18 acetylase RimI-like enzyme
VATNAILDKEGANLLARMANSGLARSIRPVHTLVDGDTVFALASGEVECDVNLLGGVAADLLARAVVRAVMRAESLHGVPCAHDLHGPARGLRIRAVNATTLEADIEAVRAAGRTILTWFRPSSVEEMIPEEMRRRTTLVAEIEGKVVGYLLHGPSDDHPEEGLTEVHWIGVDAGYRGRGVGHALIRALEEELIERGGGTLELYTVPDCEHYPPYDSTREFYRRIGFTDFYVDATAHARIGMEKLYLRKRVGRAGPPTP